VPNLVNISPALRADKPQSAQAPGKLRVIELRGTPYEHGLTHGKILKAEIQELVKPWKADLEKTYPVPAETFSALFLAACDFKPAIERWTPGLLDEIRGIAEGAGADFETMYAFQLVDESWVMGGDLGLSKCTSMAARKRGNSPAFVAQNMDIPPFYHRFQTVLRIEGGADKASDFERSVGKMVEFLPFNGAEFTYHTNYPVVNEDFNPKFTDALKKKGTTLKKYKATKRAAAGSSSSVRHSRTTRRRSTSPSSRRFSPTAAPESICGRSLSSSASRADSPLPGAVPLLRPIPGRV
jgi:hypothetical protein